MAPDPGKWERMAFIPKSRHRADPPVVPPEQLPLYTSLARQWAESGRAVPGVPDREWERLARAPIWPHRRGNSTGQ
ncbi:hypothetical protein SLA_4821 [Streptomyces laurentii]|uniref:Uncharacterized protein n=1 Tax=Streptomyces laurentii TaxID=39478 RepID=A0A160P4B1_STRLU|nr:hypothetical protein SLA_4821 [Streptomyces laurentii]